MGDVSAHNDYLNEDINITLKVTKARFNGISSSIGYIDVITNNLISIEEGGTYSISNFIQNDHIVSYDIVKGNDKVRNEENLHLIGNQFTNLQWQNWESTLNNESEIFIPVPIPNFGNFDIISNFSLFIDNFEDVFVINITRTIELANPEASNLPIYFHLEFNVAYSKETGIATFRQIKSTSIENGFTQNGETITVQVDDERSPGRLYIFLAIFVLIIFILYKQRKRRIQN